MLPQAPPPQAPPPGTATVPQAPPPRLLCRVRVAQGCAPTAPAPPVPGRERQVGGRRKAVVKPASDVRDQVKGSALASRQQLWPIYLPDQVSPRSSGQIPGQREHSAPTPSWTAIPHLCAPGWQRRRAALVLTTPRLRPRAGTRCPNIHQLRPAAHSLSPPAQRAGATEMTPSPASSQENKLRKPTRNNNNKSDIY